MLDRGEFLSACKTILAADQRISDLHEMFEKVDKEHYRLRSLSIRLLASAIGAGDDLDYFFDECLSMDGGGKVVFPCGREFPLRTPEDFWEMLAYSRTSTAREPEPSNRINREQNAGKSRNGK